MWNVPLSRGQTPGWWGSPAGPTPAGLGSRPGRLSWHRHMPASSSEPCLCRNTRTQHDPWAHGRAAAALNLSWSEVAFRAVIRCWNLSGVCFTQEEDGCLSGLWSWIKVLDRGNVINGTRGKDILHTWMSISLTRCLSDKKPGKGAEEGCMSSVSHHYRLWRLLDVPTAV